MSTEHEHPKTPRFYVLCIAEQDRADAPKGEAYVIAIADTQADAMVHAHERANGRDVWIESRTDDEHTDHAATHARHWPTPPTRPA